MSRLSIKVTEAILDDNDDIKAKEFLCLIHFVIDIKRIQLQDKDENP